MHIPPIERPIPAHNPLFEAEAFDAGRYAMAMCGSGLRKAIVEFRK
jgi:hypothetical protein